jgi:hypothetical protein
MKPWQSKKEDIISLKKTGGIEPADFFFDKPNYTEINNKLEEYIKSEFGTSIPKNITDEQAAKLLSIMEISFHNIVEYSDDVVINPAEFKFNIEDEVDGF